MRTVGLRGAMVAAVVSVSLASAATASAAGIATKFTSKGPGAEALFSTFPASGIPVPGTVYTDTYVTADSQATIINTQKTLDQFLFLDQFSYEFDSSGNFIPVSDTSGYTDGSAVTLSINSKLTSASASAVVPLTTCTFDSSGNPTCGPASSTAVSASWTGQGPLARINSHTVFQTKGTTDVSSFHGTDRQATASLSIGGNGVTAPLAGADIFDSTFKDTCISHTGSCGP